MKKEYHVVKQRVKKEEVVMNDRKVFMKIYLAEKDINKRMKMLTQYLNSKAIYSSNKVNYLMIFQLIFIAFKIGGFIPWSWAIVLIPLWINLGIFVILFIFICFILGYGLNNND